MKLFGYEVKCSVTKIPAPPRPKPAAWPVPHEHIPAKTLKQVEKELAVVVRERDAREQKLREEAFPWATA